VSVIVSGLVLFTDQKFQDVKRQNLEVSIRWGRSFDNGKSLDPAAPPQHTTGAWANALLVGR
jgi:hypothetical protein